MSPRRPDPEIRMRLIEAAARRLAAGGPPAVSARSVAQDVKASTMAVYTHFGSMDELLAEVWREGFHRFAEALESPSTTSDPVADWMCQGLAYRHFARTNPHLYRTMFQDGLIRMGSGQPEDAEAALNTFLCLLERVERCQAAGRWTVPELGAAGEAIWAFSHGQASIEAVGYYEAVGRRSLEPMKEGMVRIAVGYGDELSRARESLRRALKRAGRAGHVE